MVRAKLVLLAVLLCGCTSNPYFIGAQGSGGAANVDPRLSFALDLDQSGSAALDAALPLVAGSVPISLVFHGEKASAAAWPAAPGGSLESGPALPGVQLPAPFTDDTRAVSFPPGSPSYSASTAELGALASGDFALELVLRAAPGAVIADKRSGGVGWAIGVAADGTLGLTLQGDQGQALVASE